MATLPRLYLDLDLSTETEVEIDGNPAHYLSRVMRLRVGDEFRAFNGRHGEWRLRIARMTGKMIVAVAMMQTRQQPPKADTAPDLMFAPLKKTRTDFVVEKAAEMGAGRLIPVITARTQTRTVRSDRLQALAIEASEQTERMDIPSIEDSQSLEAAVSAYSGQIFFCDEAGDDPQAIWGGDRGRAVGFETERLGEEPDRQVCILVGPEGGFSPDERDWLRSLEFVTPVTLGPRILRAETAVVAALTIWQALAGDWRKAPRDS